MPKIETLIFDLDGVLVDTVGLHFQSWQMLAQQFDRSLSQAELTHFRGRHRRDCVIALFAPHTLTPTEIDTFLTIKNNAYLDLLEQTAPDALLMPGVLPLLESARQRGLRIGVASSSMNALPVLRRVGLDQAFDVIADGATVAHTKPAPDIFLWTAGALHTRPAGCIVFEDSEAGVIAAHRAGMYVVGVGAGLQQAHCVLPDIEAVSLEDVLHTAAAANPKEQTC